MNSIDIFMDEILKVAMRVSGGPKVAARTPPKPVGVTGSPAPAPAAPAGTPPPAKPPSPATRASASAARQAWLKPMPMTSPSTGA